MSTAFYVTLGVGLAATHVLLLASNARLYASGAHSGRAAAMHLVRIVAIAGAFVAIALAGARPLVVSALGFTCAYPFVVNAMRRLA